LLSGLLFGVRAIDSVVFMISPITLAMVAFLAVWLPARRASRLNPIEALRHE
jgi:ABC-type lipoprotein release transport system permease subunit